MKEQYYRAYHKRHGMIYPEEYFTLQDAISGDLTFFGSPAKDYDVEDFILMEYTGLKDRNGKHIFDGDIVKVIGLYDKQDAQVVWEKVGNMYQWMNGETWVLRFAGGAGGPLSPYCRPRNGYDVVIIGTIHENPELLQVS